MSASSRSSYSFTTSCALVGAEGSMRMSSGASAAYEKPRSGRSSCIDDTPRSSRIASARTPLSASPRRTDENSPCSSRALTPPARRTRSKYGATVGSRSIAISFPSPRSRAASSSACPPAPKVASTIVCPGRGSRPASTSPARTGTWSVSVGNTLGNILRAPFDLVQVRAPRRAVPDLEVVVDTGDGDLPAEPGTLDERRRQHHPPLLVQFARGRSREEVPLHHARLPAEGVERVDPLRKPLPVRPRMGVQAPVHPAADDDAVCERVTQLRRKGETVLVVERVVMGTQQHGPLRPTLPHFIPPVNPLPEKRLPRPTHVLRPRR